MNPMSKQRTRKKKNSDAIFMVLFLLIFSICIIPFIIQKYKQKEIPSKLTINKTINKVAGPGYPPADVIKKPAINFKYSDDLSIDQAKFQSEAVLLYDVDSDTVIYRKNSDKAMFPASTTKIMTAYVALKYLPTDYKINIGSELTMLAPDSSVADLIQGNILTLEDALYALLLPSGNDAAYSIAVNTARHVSKNSMMSDSDAIKYFCELMNKEAEDVGALHTHFCNPDGYHDVFHYTTAEDLLRISILAKQYPMIAQIAATPSRETDIISGQHFYWENGNCLVLSGNNYSVPYATGLKTGFTDPAGYCMVATASKDGKELIAVTMKSPSLSGRYTDAANLIYSVFEPEKMFADQTTPPEQTPPA